MGRKELKIVLLQWLAFGLILPLLSACAPQLEPRAGTSSQERSSDLDAQASEAIGSCSFDLPDGTTDAEAIWALIAAEASYVVGQEIEPLMRLWAADGRVSDAKHTPQTKEDDQNWQGADAIRYRYTRVVFPSAPDQIEPANLNIQIEAQHATTGLRAAITATTQIGDATLTSRELSPKGDQWQAVKTQGCWLIQSLTFNLEAP